MPGVLVYPHADQLLRDLKPTHAIHTRETVALGAHRDEGNLVVVLAVLIAGQWVIAEVDLALFLTAADAFAVEHGDPRTCRVLDAPTCDRGTGGCPRRHAGRRC